jgi:hypothetical protein
MSTAQNSQSQTFLDTMARQRQVTAYVLLGMGAAIWITLAILGFVFKTKLVSEIFVFALVAPVFLACGVYQLVRKEGDTSLSNLDAARLVVLLLGASVGFAIAFDAFIRSIMWWEWLSGGLEKWQEPGAWRVWLVLFGGPLGLAIMFITLLLARSQEQTSPFMRRVLYGYNAIVSSLLMLMILVVINILAYLYIPKTSDWTATGLYTLSSEAENTLKNLEQPVKIYVLTDTRGDDVYHEVDLLLENFRAVSNKVTTEEVLRNKQPQRLAELAKRYNLADTRGLLVVSGSDAKELYQFIRLEDMIERPRGMMDPTERDKPPKFKGEDVLISTIQFLEGGKAKPVIYFTQGQGELDILGDMQGLRREDERATMLRDRLVNANYEVKGLRISPIGKGKGDDPRLVTAKEVPDDAAVVIVARPRSTMPADVVDALREYLSPKDPNKKKGKLVVLLNFDLGTDGKMLKTGLERLLAEFNVEVTNDRILAIKSDPDALNVIANPRITDRNPVAAAFWRGRVAIPMRGVRAIKPNQGGGPRPGADRYQAEILLATYADRVWPEPRLGDPTRILEDMIKNHPEELQDKYTTGLPVALAVSESQLPADAAHAALRGMGEEKPRMVVFGNATWAADGGMGRAAKNRMADETYALMASSIAWLRERPGNIGIPPKDRDTYAISNDTSLARLLLNPASFMFVGIFGVGLGVWAVRRR